MKAFQQNQQRAAIEHAAQGGISLHLLNGCFAYMRKDTPICFKNRKQIAHLFCRDAKKLARLNHSLGVRIVKVEKVGQPGQHTDLCGEPLERAIGAAKALL